EEGYHEKILGAEFLEGEEEDDDEENTDENIRCVVQDIQDKDGHGEIEYQGQDRFFLRLEEETGIRIEYDDSYAQVDERKGDEKGGGVKSGHLYDKRAEIPHPEGIIGHGGLAHGRLFVKLVQGFGVDHSHGVEDMGIDIRPSRAVIDSDGDDVSEEEESYQEIEEIPCLC
ncbi:MAG: hypothetical protein LUQ67_02045, partial [Methanomicrobiales archaeon]|nr:hypothetical protein [Methanomicrobiales archaeon]